GATATSASSASPGPSPDPAAASEAAAASKARIAGRASGRLAAAIDPDRHTAALTAGASARPARGGKAKPEARTSQVGPRASAPGDHGGRRLFRAGSSQGPGGLAVLDASDCRSRRPAKPQGRQAARPVLAAPQA